MTKAVHLACPKAPIANAQVYTRLGFRTQFLSSLSLSLLARLRAAPPSSLPPTLVLLVLQRARLPPPSSAPSLAKLPLKQQAIFGWRPAPLLQLTQELPSSAVQASAPSRSGLRVLSGLDPAQPGPGGRWRRELAGASRGRQMQ